VEGIYLRFFIFDFRFSIFHFPFFIFHLTPWAMTDKENQEQ